jgi:lipoprotein-releasing system permease protein
VSIPATHHRSASLASPCLDISVRFLTFKGVQLPFSFFLALRFLKPKRTFVSVITVISVLGVTLGIAVLILVISVMTGFDLELRRKVLGFDPHIVVTNGGAPLADWREIPPKLAGFKGVSESAPYVQGPVLLASAPGDVRSAQVRGVDPATEGAREGVQGSIVAGEFDMKGESCILGLELARSLQVNIGDKVTAYPAKDFGPILAALNEAEKSENPKEAIAKLRNLVLPMELTVKGVFSSGRYQYDSDVFLVPLQIAQELYGLEDSVHGISVWLHEPYSAPVYADRIRTKLYPAHEALEVLTWIDLNREIFDAIRLERNTMFFLLLFIVIVAAFSIMNTLITVTVLKTREIGVMKALGATRWQIVWVFLLQGMVVGFFGNLSGVGLGLSILHWRNEFKDWLATRLGFEIFPPGIYQFREIPAELIPADLAVICLSAFVICSLAALFPALVAARLEPVKALRHD